jgi:hypothetical protein
MLVLKDRPDFTEGQGDKYYECHICGPQKYWSVIHFDSGSVAPTVGETVTGATTADTGTIETVTLSSGTYAGRDAVGVIVLSGVSGYNRDTLLVFQNDEALNGSTSGNDFATVNGTTGVTRNGRIYPEWAIVEYEGRRYCRDHFPWRWRREWEKDTALDISESDRFK